MKKTLLRLVSVVIVALGIVYLVQTQSQAESYSNGFVQLCNVYKNGSIFNFVPPVLSVTDQRIGQTNWSDLSKTMCIGRGDPVNQQGQCHPFPNYQSGQPYTLDPTAPNCQPGATEKANAYVCDTPNELWYGCGASAIKKVTNNPAGQKLTLGNVNTLVGTSCEQTIQMDLFNSTCTEAMITQHYSVPSGDSDHDGIDDPFDPDFFPTDQNGVKTFCLAKDSFVWYTGACTPQIAKPYLEIKKRIVEDTNDTPNPSKEVKLVNVAQKVWVELTVTNTGDGKFDHTKNSAITVVDNLNEVQAGAVGYTKKVVTEDTGTVCSFTDADSTATCLTDNHSLNPGQSFKTYLQVNVIKVPTSGGAPIACDGNGANYTNHSRLSYFYEVKEECPASFDTNDKQCSQAPLCIQEPQNLLPKLSIDKQLIKGAVVAPGDTIEYKIIIKNTGAGRAEGVVFEDQLPSQLEYSTAQVTFEPTRTGFGYNKETGKISSGNGGFYLDSQRQITVTVVAKTKTTLSQTSPIIENTACITDDSITPTNKLCDKVQSQIVIPGQDVKSITIDKEIDTSKSDGTDPYQDNELVTFKLKVTNTGNTVLHPVVVKETVPSYTEFDEAKAKQYNDTLNWGSTAWACSNNTCLFTIDSMSPGQTVYIYFSVKVATDEKDKHTTNTACVSYDNFASQACDDKSITINNEKGDSPKEDVEFDVEKYVRKENGKDWKEKITSVEKGQTIEFKIKVKNDGNIEANDMRYVDNLPDELKRTGGSDLKETWNNFEAGDKKEFTIKAQVKDSEFDKTVDKCVTNKVKVYYKNKEVGKAEATVCYSNKSITELPATGASANELLGLVGMVSTTLGITLKRKFVLA